MSYENQRPIIDLYSDKIASITEELEFNKKRSFRFSMIRLGVIVIALPLIYFATKWGVLSIVAIVLTVIISFVYAVLKQQGFDHKIKSCENLLWINKNEIRAIKALDNEFYDGAKFDQAHHLYTDDLDIFGKNSLYKLITRSKSYDGIHQLASFFLHLPDVEEIKDRQEAIRELEVLTDWRQDLADSLFDIENGHQKDLGSEIESELNVDLSFVSNKYLQLYRRSLPFLWLLIILFYFLDATIANSLATLLFIGNLLLTMKRASEVAGIQAHLSKASSIILNYASAVKLIFKQEWKAKLLKREVRSFSGDDKDHSVQMLRSLSKIIDHLDFRLNLIPAVILNGILLWDFAVLWRLQKWKLENENKVKKLFELVGKFEALSSLATWSFNHPSYHYANVHADYLSLTAQEARHPLIPADESVPNDFNINNGSHLSIITGSNMSGKSTLLRTLGINAILAYTGGKVAADHFELPLVKVVSYMRIKDILEESVSTFKAELNRIEMILGMLSQGEKCLILIDEMLRGTNSKDKLAGSIGIARRLLEEKTYALIATHDIKLAELGNEIKDGIANYYFDIDYADGDLVFDYKVKHGICENFNASFLLQRLGIEMPS